MKRGAKVTTVIDLDPILYYNRLKVPSNGSNLVEYCIVQPRPAAEMGPPQASEVKIGSCGPLVASAELQSLLIY